MARILIVDDSPTEMHLLVNMVTGQGHEVVTATTGADGVAAALAERPDLVLMDVVMPGVNGFQATRQIRRQTETSTTPIVIVSTKDQETDRVWAQRQGASAYLTKPVDEGRLLSTINDLLAG